MTRLNKILLSIILVLSIGALCYHTPSTIKNIKENYIEHTDPSIAMVMNGRGHGTGFFIYNNILITNAHVVNNSDYVKVQLSNNSIISGKVVGTNKEHDLALIKVDYHCKEVVKLSLGHLKRGDSVYAIGFGDNTWYSARYGEVLYHYLMDIPQYKIRAMYVRASLDVKPGHSGSPVFNDSGNVVGIVSLGGGGETMFIPTRYIVDFYNQYLTFLKKLAIMEAREKEEKRIKAIQDAARKKREAVKPEV